MGRQKNIARQVVWGGTGYLLAVKANQGELHQNIKDPFARCESEGWDGGPTATANRPARTMAGWKAVSAG